MIHFAPPWYNKSWPLFKYVSTFYLWDTAIYYRPYNEHRYSDILNPDRVACAALYLQNPPAKHPATHIEAVKIGGAAAFKIAAIFVDFWHARFFALITP